jgi:hypothetical protein
MIDWNLEPLLNFSACFAHFADKNVSSWMKITILRSIGLVACGS